jgi:hypothetical protein
MPTPDDAMLSPPAEHESAVPGRATCPPEESCIHDPHEMMAERSIHDDSIVDTPPNAPTQQPTPPPGDRDARSDTDSPAESSSKTLNAQIDAPIRDIPTPMSAMDEAAEEQRNPQASPLSATAPGPVSWHQPTILASPFPSQRVRIAAIPQQCDPIVRQKG